MKKFLALVVCAFLTLGILSGCAPDKTPDTQVPDTTQEPGNNQQPDKNGENNANDETEKTPPDAVTTASIVDDEAAFIKAISKDGTWIICTLKDLTIDQELVLEGEFHDKDDKNNPLYRKIALYTQDDNRNVTNRFTLTAPKLTIRSENAKIQGGTFKGDVYVEAKGFTITDGKVDGNVYFANEEAKSTFKMENGGTVTGVQEIRQ
jgi:hypothetical protein